MLNTATLFQRNRAIGYSVKGQQDNGAMRKGKERLYSRKTCQKEMRQKKHTRGIFKFPGFSSEVCFK